MRRYDEAVQFCQQQLAASPRCVTFRLLRAQALFAMGDRANAVAELQRCLRIDSTCQAARTLLDAVANVEEQLRQEKRERGEAPRERREPPRERRAQPQVQAQPQPQPQPQRRGQPQAQRREQPQAQRREQPQAQRREQPQPQARREPSQPEPQRARYEYVPPPREQPQRREQLQPQPQRREQPQARREQAAPQQRREQPRREPAREPVGLQPLAHAVPRPVPSAAPAARDQAQILALFDEDADIPTDVKRPPRPVARPEAPSFDPLAIAPSGRRSIEPQPRITFDPQPLPAIAPLPLPPLAPPRHAQLERQPQPSPQAQPQPQPHPHPHPHPQLQRQPEAQPRVAVDPPHRRRAERPSRPAFDPPSTPPRRATAADSAPFVLPQRPRRASTSWQRPLSIESRRPPLSRPALIAVALLAVAALWLVRPNTPAQLPSASLATAASRPAPEPPAPKAEKPPASDLVADVWIHPLQGPSRRMPIHDSRLFGAERLGDRPSECRGGHCGIDLGGAYGEPVYAVHDGVIDRVQRAANEDHGGHYVRIAHNDGTVITQYFHLSSIPRRLAEGGRIKAGDLVGWIGLSGIKHSEPHLHFTVSVQDPSGADGRYLDPEPLVALWPLRLPAKGDDKLHLSTTAPPGLARGFIRRRHHHRARNVETAPVAE